MKISRLCLVMLAGVGAMALFSLLFSFTEMSGLPAPSSSGGVIAIKAPNRKLKDEAGGQGTHGRTGGGYVHTEDYGPVDPVPDSKTTIRAGPIDHGTPIIPYLPPPTAPGPPKQGG